LLLRERGKRQKAKGKKKKKEAPLNLPKGEKPEETQ
jgi:hypothetical protein